MMAISARWKATLTAVALLSVILPLDTGAQTLLWSTNYGGWLKDEGSAVCPTGDGGYAAAGSTYSFGEGDFDIYFLRVNADGDTLRTRTFGGTLTEYGHDICRTFDGGFVIVGSTTSSGAGKEDVYLLKIDEFGSKLWSRTYGGAANDEGWSVRQTRDSGFIVCGTTESYGAGYTDVYLLKLTRTGDTIWTRTFGGPGGDVGFAVRQAPDSSYIIVGSTGSFGEGYSSVYAIKTDLSGNARWTSTYGGAKADFGYSVETTFDGGYIIAGNSWSFATLNSEAYLVKLNEEGVIEWENTYGGPFEEIAYCVRPTIDGGYVLAGSTESYGSGGTDMYVVKTDPLGVALWSQTYGGSKSDVCRAVIEDTPEQLVLLGSSHSFTAGSSDIYILKIQVESATPVEEPSDDILPEDFQLAQNYPNPFNNETTIEYSLPYRAPVRLTIYNVLGQVVRQWEFSSQSAGLHRVSWDGTSSDGHAVATGMYLYRIETTEFRATKKMILLK